ncbi:MAG TPA: aminotransferase class V-fold PLP-dependent enzyme, partial [Acidimicrobiales bacterium]|nr:aminotransferase class V-fold PLP-dependent enzyme [Acidimicrobiales bacterium]
MSAYLDHAASTPLRPEALEAMLPYLREHYGNPSGAHRVSGAARLAVDEARDTAAECLGCE